MLTSSIKNMTRLKETTDKLKMTRDRLCVKFLVRGSRQVPRVKQDNYLWRRLVIVIARNLNAYMYFQQGLRAWKISRGLEGVQGSYRKLQPFFKDFSRTFQGSNLFFKDPSNECNVTGLIV